MERETRTNDMFRIGTASPFGSPPITYVATSAILRNTSAIASFDQTLHQCSKKSKGVPSISLVALTTRRVHFNEALLTYKKGNKSTILRQTSNVHPRDSLPGS